jgi:hypothetical protein
MVTVNFAQSAGISIFALFGMVIGFRLQDDFRKRSEARVAKRIEEEFLKRLKERREAEKKNDNNNNKLVE